MNAAVTKGSSGADVVIPKMPEGLTPDDRYAFSEYAGKLLSDGVHPRVADIQALAVIMARRNLTGGAT
jgi:hypothetical protein